MARRDRPLRPRRNVLRLVGSGAALALAGCTGGDGTADDEPTDETTESPEEGETDEPAGVEPVAVPEDASCAVCEMNVAKFADWHAQAVHEDDTRAFFCTAGCGTTYYVLPGEFAETEAAIAGFWVTDFETGDLIDGLEAHYALETDSDRVDDPMGLNPAPFADREDAIAYVDAVDYLSEADVVGLSAFDRDVVSQYRGRLLPGDDTVAAVDVPEDAACAVCGMDAAKFPDWNAQAVHEDETRAFFCSAGCGVTYHVAPDVFAETDAAVAGLWVTDLETREFVDGTTAYFALETESDRLEDPMMVNPAPFADRADAVAYVDAVAYLTTEDIVQLSSFDRELAAQYRGKFLESQS